MEEDDLGRQFTVRQRDEIRLKLTENPTTGYRWQLPKEENPSIVVIGDEYEVVDASTVGSQGHRFLSLRADRAGSCKLLLELRREWQANSRIKSFEIFVQITDNEFGGERSGLRETVKKEILSQV